MWSRPRLTLLITATASTVMVALVFLAWQAREPTYKGLTIRDWLSLVMDPEQNEALVVLGTNNLQLLLHRIDYDPVSDRTLRLYARFPVQLRRSNGMFFNIATERMTMARDANEVLKQLGPLASPLVRQLSQIAHTHGEFPARRALSVLDTIGEQARPAIISLVGHTNSTMRFEAMLRLAEYTNSLPAREALTNALADPDPEIRKHAQDILTGRAFE